MSYKSTKYSHSGPPLNAPIRLKTFLVIERLSSSKLLLLHRRMAYKIWKGIDVYNIIFQALKVMEFEYGSWKVMEND